MENFIYSNTYSDNELLIERMKENVEYAIRRLASHLEHNYPMNYVDQLAVENIRESVNNKTEKEQALEIIVKKDVDVEYLKTCIYSSGFIDLEEYNAYVDGDKELTRKEIELVAKVIKEIGEDEVK